MKKRAGVGLLVATVVALSGCAGTTVSGVVPTPSATVPRTPTPKPPTPTPTPPEVRVFHPGPEVAAIRSQEGVATIAVRGYSWQQTENGPYAKAPQQRYLVLDLNITATEGKVQVNPLYFTLRTAGGAELQPVLGLDGNEPVLASKELNAPEAVGGLVTFDTAQEPVVLLVADEVGNRIAQIPIPTGPPEPAADPAQPNQGQQPGQGQPPANPTANPSAANPPAANPPTPSARPAN